MNRHFLIYLQPLPLWRPFFTTFTFAQYGEVGNG